MKVLDVVGELGVQESGRVRASDLEQAEFGQSTEPWAVDKDSARSAILSRRTRLSTVRVFPQSQSEPLQGFCEFGLV
ncbi:MAG: hypothetical protein R3E48_20970 [Burkholderiaceae bacterium]